MYAILEAKGKQYRVEKGDVIDIELDQAKEKIEFETVLLFCEEDKKEIGTPYVKNCKVTGEVLGIAQGPKVISYKYKRRKNYRRKKGHKQKYTKIKISNIEFGTKPKIAKETTEKVVKETKATVKKETKSKAPKDTKAKPKKETKAKAPKKETK